jgi:hypothetical protein
MPILGIEFSMQPMDSQVSHSTHTKYQGLTKYHFRSSFWGGERGGGEDDKCVLSLPAPAHHLTIKDGWMDVWMDDKWSRNNFLLGCSSLANHGGLAHLLLLKTTYLPTYLPTY